MKCLFKTSCYFAIRRKSKSTKWLCQEPRTIVLIICLQFWSRSSLHIFSQHFTCFWKVFFFFSFFSETWNNPISDAIKATGQKSSAECCKIQHLMPRSMIMPKITNKRKKWKFSGILKFRLLLVLVLNRPIRITLLKILISLSFLLRYNLVVCQCEISNLLNSFCFCCCCCYFEWLQCYQNLKKK